MLDLSSSLVPVGHVSPSRPTGSGTGSRGRPELSPQPPTSHPPAHSEDDPILAVRECKLEGVHREPARQNETPVGDARLLSNHRPVQRLRRTHTQTHRPLHEFSPGAPAASNLFNRSEFNKPDPAIPLHAIVDPVRKGRGGGLARGRLRGIWPPLGRGHDQGGGVALGAPFEERAQTQAGHPVQRKVPVLSRPSDRRGVGTDVRRRSGLLLHPIPSRREGGSFSMNGEEERSTVSKHTVHFAWHCDVSVRFTMPIILLTLTVLSEGVLGVLVRFKKPLYVVSSWETPLVWGGRGWKECTPLECHAWRPGHFASTTRSSRGN